MNIKANNQHDYYAIPTCMVLSVNQAANAFLNLHNALCNNMVAIKKAMQEELDKENPNESEERQQPPQSQPQ